jgi:ketosteroid isomerase-like protein
VPSREEIVERSFEAFDNGDWELLESLWELDSEIIGPQPWPETGLISGRPAVMAQFQRLKDSWSSSRLEVISHRSSGDRLCTHFRWDVRGEASGLSSETEMWMVSDFRGDRYIRAQYFMDEAAATAAFEGKAP